MNEIKFPDDIIEDARDELNEEADLTEDEAQTVIDQALLILDVWDPSAYGKAPTGVAATVLYCAARANEIKLTQEKVCEIVGSSTMTIRKQQGECLKTAREKDVL